MSIRHSFFKILAVYLVIALVSFAPVASIQKAAQAIGLKQLLVGGLVGAAGLLAIGALTGPAAAIGAAGCAGTGFMSVLGGALGTLVSGVTGICSAMGTLSMSTMATLGLMMGGAAIGIMGLMGSGFVAVPALILGGGLLAYFWQRSSYRYGTPYDQRYSGPLHDPFFDGSSRLGNQSASGYSGGNVGTSGSFADKVRSIFDRDRRDDSFFTNNRYVDQSGYVRQGSDFFGTVDRYFNGRNAGYTGGNPMYQGASPYGSVGGQYSTGRVGTVVGYGSNPVRSGFSTYAPTETPADVEKPVSEDVTHDDLVKAEAERKAAYENLIETIRTQEKDGAPSAIVTTGLRSEEAQEAIRAYKAADKLVKEITGRLQHREKQ